MTEQLDGKWEAPSADLGRVLHNVSLFAGKDATRPVLTNIRLRFGKDRLTVTATDSYVMGEESLPIIGTDTDNIGPSVMLPARELLPAIKCLLTRRSHKPDAIILVEGRTVTFTVEGSSFSIGIYDGGEYPNTDQLWPSEDAEPSITSSGIGLRSPQLALLSKLLDDSGKKASDVRFRFASDVRPVLVTRKDYGSTFRALLMPVKY